MSSATGAGIELDATGYRADNHTAIPATPLLSCQMACLSSASESARRQHADTVEQLQSRIRELEKKTELQNVRHEELLLEMAALKRAAHQQVSALWNRYSMYSSNSNKIIV